MTGVRTCPSCAEEIKAEAKVCKHCGKRQAQFTAGGRQKLARWQIMLIGGVSAAVVLVLAVGAVLAYQSRQESEQSERNAQEMVDRAQARTDEIRCIDERATLVDAVREFRRQVGNHEPVTMRLLLNTGLVEETPQFYRVTITGKVEPTAAGKVC